MGPRGWTLSRCRLGVNDVRDRFPFRATVFQVHADQLWIYYRLFCVDRTCVGNLEVTPWERKHPESSDHSLTRWLSAPGTDSVARLRAFISSLMAYPALKCWAIIMRPLCGRITTIKL